MHQPIKDRSGQDGVAEAFAPVVDDAVRSDNGTAPQRVAAMQDSLQFIGGFGGDLSTQKEVIEDEEVRVDERLQEFLLAQRLDGGDGELAQQLIGLDVCDV